MSSREVEKNSILSNTSAQESSEHLTRLALPPASQDVQRQRESDFSKLKLAQAAQVLSPFDQDKQRLLDAHDPQKVSKESLKRLVDLGDPKVDNELETILKTSTNLRQQFLVAEALYSAKSDAVAKDYLLRWTKEETPGLPARPLAVLTPRMDTDISSVTLEQLLRKPENVPRSSCQDMNLYFQNPPERERMLDEFRKTLETLPSGNDSYKYSANEYMQNIRRSFDLGIESPFRFEARDLEHIVDARMRADEKSDLREGNRTAVVVFPKDEKSYAFSQEADEFRRLRKNDYEVVYYEAGSDKEFKDILQNKAPRNSDLLILGGHGSQQSFQLSTVSPDISDPAAKAEALNRAEVDDTELREMKGSGVEGVLKKGGKIVVLACSGAKKGHGDNVIKALRHTFPNAAKFGIFGPGDDARGMTLDFADDGELHSVTYGDAPTMQK